MADTEELVGLEKAVMDCCECVYTEIGPAASERCYHEALTVELRLRGIPYERERHALMKYKGHVIGSVRIDLVVDDALIVELKAVTRDEVPSSAQQQLDLYMRTLQKDGMVVNFVDAPCGQLRRLSRKFKK
jgi:GxxExxY protein